MKSREECFLIYPREFLPFLIWTRSSIVAVVKKGEAIEQKCGAHVHAINT
jgi:hypothetical protein